MSEKGKRAAPNGPGSGKGASTSSDGKKFAVDLQKIVSDLESLCKSNDGVQEYGNLLTSQVALKKEVEKLEREASRLQREVKDLQDKREDDMQKVQKKMDELKRHNDYLMAEYGEKYKVWDEDKRSHADDLEKLARLQEELETATVEVENLQADNEELCEHKVKLAKKFDEYERKMAALRDRCEMKELELKEATRKRDEYRMVSREAKEQLGTIPLKFEKR